MLRVMLPLVIVIALVGVGVLRYVSPAWVIRGFMSDLSQGHWSSAQAMFCHQQDGNEIQNRLGGWYHTDLSQVSYSVSAESLLDARVHAQGPLSGSLGETVLLHWNTQISLQARGISWCIASNYLTIYGTLRADSVLKSAEFYVT